MVLTVFSKFGEFLFQKKQLLKNFDITLKKKNACLGKKATKNPKVLELQKHEADKAGGVQFGFVETVLYQYF